MKCIFFCAFILAAAAFVYSSGCDAGKPDSSPETKMPRSDKKTSPAPIIGKLDFLERHPTLDYDRENVRSGKVPGKAEAYLRSYLKDELSVPREQLIQSLNDKFGDFGLPRDLPADRAMHDFLSYRADHYRVAYLHLGREPSPGNTRFTYLAGALRDLWLYYDDEEAKQRFVIIYRHALRNFEAMTDEELAAKFDGRGSLNLWHSLLKCAALYYSLLYEATGEEHFAHRACLILHRFGEVFDQWQLHYKPSEGNLKPGEEAKSVTLDKVPPREAWHFGLWGYWGNVHDLNQTAGLADAYALVRNSESFNSLSSVGKDTIENGLFTKMIEKYQLLTFQPLHNQSQNRIHGMAYFGKRLRRPEYVHIAVRWLEEMLRIGYRRDGFWCEGTEAYGWGVTEGLLKTAEFLRGWSDPVGYADAVDKSRYDGLDLMEKYSADFNRIKTAFNLLALPNGQSIALEDTTWNAQFRFGNPPTSAQSFLLGASGVGMLGRGDGNNQWRLYLHWDDFAGHDHYDSLGMALWAGGEEIASETGYRGLHDWNVSTYAHNTVVIDETNQQGFKEHMRQKPDDVVYQYPHYKYGDLWGGWRGFCDDLGQLRLWDSTRSEIKIVEVDGSRAYEKKAEIYDRTLALVKIDEKRSYVLDIFRVKGGNRHDWMLHGNLSTRYRIELGEGNLPPLREISGKLGEHLQIKRGMEKCDQETVAIFAAPGGAKLRTLIAGGKETDVLIAAGPAIRLESEPSCWGKPGVVSSTKCETSETSEFLCLRRQGPENVFVAAYEIADGQATLKTLNVNEATVDGEVAVRITLADNRVDTFHAFPGKLTWQQTDAAGNQQAAAAFGATPLTGKVLSVASTSQGDKRNSFTVSGDLRGKANPGDLILILDGEGRRHSYIVKDILPDDAGSSAILVEGETGMRLEADRVVMTYYPCWDVKGGLTYVLPGSQEEPNSAR
jgi:hypothetical protein